MTWKKYFKPVNTVTPSQRSGSGQVQSSSKFNNWLPEIYQGPPDRLQRYTQYEQMDMDHEVSAALDTLAEFCTQKSESSETPFDITYINTPSEVESNIISGALKRWCSINDFNRRMFRMVRSTLMYGDQLFIRDPETFKLYWVDPNNIEKVIVNESKGKKIETYFIKDLDLNHQSLVASSMTGSTKGGFANKSQAFPQGTLANMQSQAQGVTSAYFSGSSGQDSDMSAPVAAENIVHMSMTEGMDSAWPFGISELEPVFKIFKQKSMLEDAMLIYRIHRAPERRIFSIDVGDMPPTQAHQHLERVKYEVQQKRMPNRTGGGDNISDSAYDPLSTLEDYYFAVTGEGRGSKVEVLPGGDNLGEINDMLYFNNKMFRALGIPSSYIPTGGDDGGAAPTDGKVGTAFIQEFRFTERCKRHQRQIVQSLDREFKLFMKENGITIDNGMFNLDFTAPQNFSEYRQIELDSARIAVFSQVQEIPFVSKQYALRRYMGWTEKDIFENEKYWKMENDSKYKDEDNGIGMGQVGMSGSDFESEDMSEFETGGEEGEDQNFDAEEVDMSDVEDFGNS